MTDSERKLGLLRLVNGLLVFVLVLTAILIGFVIKDDWISPRVDYTVSLDDGWTRINADGTEEEVSGRFSIGKTDPVTFYRTLPDFIGYKDLLRIKCPYTTVDAYIDGELIYHAGPAKLGHITTTLGNVFALIPLEREYAGKDIYITVEPRHYHFEVIIKDAAITTMSTYALMRVYECIPYGLICVILIIISVISIVLFGVFKASSRIKQNDLYKGFFHLAMFGFSAVAWIIADYHIAGMLTGRMVLSGIINYIGFMLCPFMFAGILIHVFGNNKFFRILFILSELNFVIQMILFFAGIIDLPDGLIVSQCISMLIIIGMVYFGLTMMKNMADKNVMLLALPTSLFVVFSFIAAIAYALNGEWMLCVALAMTFFAFTVITYLLINLWASLKTNIELDQIKKIAYLDDMTGLENRRAYDDYVDELTQKAEAGNKDMLLSTIVLDVNGLKKTNDIYGHAAGDELIIGSSNCIKEAFGDLGRCFRTGGDEFVVIADMPYKQFIERALILNEGLTTWTGEYVKGISISLGNADRNEFPEFSIQELLDMADKRMYENKQNYYGSQLIVDDPSYSTDPNDPKSKRKFRYVDNFALTKYTMPIIRQMAEVIPGGFFIYREDSTRELIYQNRKVLEIYGCSSLDEFKDLTGYTFKGMVHPDDFDKIQNSIDNQIDSELGDGMDHVIYRIVRKDGQVRLVDDYGHYSHSQDFGDIYYVFISDITDTRGRNY
ncbi:MAG: diguanylate cyclase [Lachnospiraceae bacterium]|nr:diguanylate cyclase [Lachnospiraceae bacterium]